MLTSIALKKIIISLITCRIMTEVQSIFSNLNKKINDNECFF